MTRHQPATARAALTGSIPTVARAGLTALLGGAAAAAGWQHRRYLRIRHTVIHDDQPIIQPRRAFHALVFLTAAPGADVVGEVRSFQNSIDESQARWVYAGKAVVTARHSTQIGEKRWDAVILLQYPSRAAYEHHAQSVQMSQALDRFEDRYIQGFQRWALASAVVPLFLLVLRGAQFLGRRPSHFPFRRARDRDTVLPAEQIAIRLRAESELGSHGIVIVNLVKNGTHEQQRANRRYAVAMFGAMAEGGYGPMHLGRPVRVEKDYDFDTVALVYYPGVEFFISLAQSDYFQSIVGDKQVADTQAVITVPIASHV